MHDLYNLRDMLCDELKEYGAKDELTAGSLDIVDKLAHALKNLDKIIENSDGYSSYYPDMSYARKRDSMGRYSRRYSRDSGMVESLKELMHEAPDERTRNELQKMISKMEK